MYLDLNVIYSSGSLFSPDWRVEAERAVFATVATDPPKQI